MKKFSQNVSKSLQHYIYAIYDPYDLTSLPFYIGQGVGNRVFSHLKESHNDSVRAKIDEIRSKGRRPNIKILLHGLNARQANAAESAAIALLGKDILSNKVFGAGSKLINLSTDEIIQHYEAKDVLLKHKIILIVRNPFDPNRSVFIDDSVSVLRAARDFGISQTIGITCPDSTLPAQKIEGFR